MSGIHGFTNALGARSAVLPVPVRRALVLAALVAAALVAVWLASAAPAQAAQASEKPAQAAQASEKPSGDSPAPRDAAPGQSGQEGQADQSAAPAQQGHAGQGGQGGQDNQGGQGGQGSGRSDDRPAAASNAKPLNGAVTSVDENAGGVVRGASDAVTPRAASQGNGVAQRVHGSSESAGGGNSEGNPHTEDEDTDEADRAEDARETDEPAADTSVVIPDHVHEEVGVPNADTDHDTLHVDPHQATHGMLADAAHSAMTSSSSSSSSASNGASGGAVIAGYLPSAGTLAPVPGLLQAARHVLHSVPAESADEPTFSPD